MSRATDMSYGARAMRATAVALSFLALGSFPGVALKVGTEQVPLKRPAEWDSPPPGPEGDDIRNEQQDKLDVMQATMPYAQAIGQLQWQCDQLQVPFEYQTVNTNDGYRLTLMRLPRPGAQPVFLQHGFMDSAWMWLHGSAPLAKLLWKEGYDVWLGNNRGNAFSRGATWLPEYMREATDATGSNLGDAFWNFTMEDIANHDLPTFISEVVKNTSKKVIYIGHSLGTTQMFIGGTEPGTREVLEKNIDFFIALSPIAYISHLQIELFRMLATNGLVLGIMQSRHHGFALSMADMRSLVPFGLGPLLEAVLDYKTFAGFGPIDDPNNEIPLRVHLPGGASVKMTLHWAQLLRDGYLHKYDYGPEGNLRAYNSIYAPRVYLSELRIPTALMFAGQDKCSPQEDQNLFQAEFPPSQVVFTKTYPQYSHITWYWGGELEYTKDVLAIVAARTAKLQR